MKNTNSAIVGSAKMHFISTASYRTAKKVFESSDDFLKLGSRDKYCEVFNLRASQVLSLSEELETIQDRKEIAKKLITFLKWTENEKS